MVVITTTMDNYEFTDTVMRDIMARALIKLIHFEFYFQPIPLSHLTPRKCGESEQLGRTKPGGSSHV